MRLQDKEQLREVVPDTRAMQTLSPRCSSSPGQVRLVQPAIGHQHQLQLPVSAIDASMTVECLVVRIPSNTQAKLVLQIYAIMHTRAIQEQTVSLVLCSASTRVCSVAAASCVILISIHECPHSLVGPALSRGQGYIGSCCPVTEVAFHDCMIA